MKLTDVNREKAVKDSRKCLARVMNEMDAREASQDRVTWSTLYISFD